MVRLFKRFKLKYGSDFLKRQIWFDGSLDLTFVTHFQIESYVELNSDDFECTNTQRAELR